MGYYPFREDEVTFLLIRSKTAVVAISQKIDDLKKEEEEAFNKFIEKKNEFGEINKNLKDREKIN